MPYIGSKPSTSFVSMSKQDLTGSSGGSVTLSHAVANANEVALYINNVRQEPTESYTVSGSTLNFNGYTVSASDDIYVIFLGKAIQTTVPPDGSVTSAKLDTNIAVSGNLTVSGAFTSQGIDDNADATAITIDSSENVLFSTTGTPDSVVGSSGVGMAYEANGFLGIAREGTPLIINRRSSNGEIISFKKDGSVVGALGTSSDTFGIHGSGSGNNASGFLFVQSSGTQRIIPCQENFTSNDNVVDLGHTSNRFDDIYATNGTIQTSDQQEKNTIEDSDLGLDFVKRLSPKSYIFNGKTRTHYGLIAQDVETVLGDINKPTSEFAGFIKDDISEEQDGSQYRYGLRYTEFVAPLIKAIKEQQTIIEDLQARITALENAE